jgi:hypothetical protein
MVNALELCNNLLHNSGFLFLAKGQQAVGFFICPPTWWTIMGVHILVNESRVKLSRRGYEAVRFVER